MRRSLAILALGLLLFGAGVTAAHAHLRPQAAPDDVLHASAPGAGPVLVCGACALAHARGIQDAPCSGLAPDAVETRTPEIPCAVVPDETPRRLPDGRAPPLSA